MVSVKSKSSKLAKCYAQTRTRRCRENALNAIERPTRTNAPYAKQPKISEFGIALIGAYKDMRF